MQIEEQVRESGETPDVDPHEQLLQLRRRVAALPELAMWRTAVVEALSDAPPASAAFMLDQLVRGTATGDDASSRAYLSAVTWFLEQEYQRDEVYYEWSREVYEVAAAEERRYVTYLLMNVPPHRKIDNPKMLRMPRFERDVTLGERKQLAAGQNRMTLTNLLLDIEPHVIRKLLINPYVQIDDVLVVATRRPTVPEVLTEIARSDRWVAVYRVQHALVQNPFANTGLALKLLPFLRGTDIRAVSFASDLHPGIAKAALELMALRKTRRIKPV